MVGEPAAVAEHDRRRRRREEVDEREVDAAQDDRLHVRDAVGVADVAEVLLRGALAGERLQDAHPGDVLRERRRDRAERLAHAAVGASRALAEERGRDGHRRHHDERRECEPPVEEEENDRGPEQRQRVLDERRDAVGHELVERLDVVREAADDHAGAVALVEAERQALQVAEEMAAQVGQHPLARPAGEVRLRVGEGDPEQAGRDEDCDELAEQRRLPRAAPRRPRGRRDTAARVRRQSRRAAR